MRKFFIDLTPFLYFAITLFVDPLLPDSAMRWVNIAYFIYLVAVVVLFYADSRVKPDGEFFINGTNEDGMPIMLNETLDSIHGKRYLILRVVE